MTRPVTVTERPLRVLIAHNEYQERGGEDRVVDAEASLLRGAGHDVRRYERSNHETAGMSKAALLRDTIWSGGTAAAIASLIREFAPDVVHVHNTFVRISPSVHWTAHRMGLPVVQTLHNFRLVCPQATLLRDQRPCEVCVGRVPWRAVVHRCYRGSLAQSVAAALTLQAHRVAGTWQLATDLFITLDSFCHDRFVRGGLPPSRLRVKPNFVHDPRPAGRSAGDDFLYVGRLSPEKGLQVLSAAVQHSPGIRLRVVGDGPMRPALSCIPGLSLEEFMPAERVAAAMQSALALVVPSLCPEMFGLVVIEAYANGLPVIASRVGALASLVEDGHTGLLVTPGDAKALADALTWAGRHRVEMGAMGHNARQRYIERYTPETNLAKLEAIYREAIALRGAI